jgi:tetratricopeptide (TPR) repeat protein
MARKLMAITANTLISGCVALLRSTTRLPAVVVEITGGQGHPPMAKVALALVGLLVIAAVGIVIAVLLVYIGLKKSPQINGVNIADAGPGYAYSAPVRVTAFVLLLALPVLVAIAFGIWWDRQTRLKPIIIPVTAERSTKPGAATNEGAVALIAQCDREISAKPNDPDAYRRRANAYDETGDYDKAIADYDKAITLKPNAESYYVCRGLSYAHKKDYDRAIEDYDKAISLRADDPDAYINRGIAYSDRAQYDKAIADYDRAISLKPDYSTAYYDRGISYEAEDKHDQAIADYDEAISLKPDG